MPIRTRFLTPRGIAVSVARGTLNFHDLMAFRAQATTAAPYAPSFALLCDGRRITRIDLNTDEIRSFADFGLPGAPRFARLALLVSNDTVRGLAGVFSAFTARYTDRDLQIFLDPREAWAWIIDPLRVRRAP